jgi:hypothetical protein
MFNKLDVVVASFVSGFDSDVVLAMFEKVEQHEDVNEYLTRYDDIREYVIDVEMFGDWLSVE